jgi:hypothetical protein
MSFCASAFDEADLAELQAMLAGAAAGAEVNVKPAGKRSRNKAAGRPTAGRADFKARLIPKAGVSLTSFEPEGVLTCHRQRVQNPDFLCHDHFVLVQLKHAMVETWLQAQKVWMTTRMMLRLWLCVQRTTSIL